MNILSKISTSICFIFCTYLSLAQNTQLQFDDSFRLIKNKQKQEIDFGKPIIITGKLGNSDINLITIKYNSYMHQGTVNAKISDGYWRANLNSFLPNDFLQITFEVHRKISKKEKDNIKQILYSQMTLLKDKIFSEMADKSFSDEELIQFVDSLWNEPERKSLKNYTTKNGKPYDKKLVEIIVEANLDNLLEKQQKVNNAIENTVKNINDKYQVKTVSSNELSDTVKSRLKSDTSRIAKNLLDRYENLKRRESDLKNEIDEQFTENVNLIVSELKEYSIDNIMTDVVDVSNFKHYIDLDIGASYMYVKKESQFGYMFLANLYCKKVDLDNHPKTWGDRLSITAGIGYTPFDSLANTPLYFIGAGLRVNPVWKSNLGFSFFRRVGNKGYDWNFTFGLSMSIKYITQLRKNFIPLFNKNDD